jgi:outer membrane protein TolC
VDRAQWTQRVARLQEDDARLAARQEADGALQAVRTAEQAIAIAQEAQAVAQEDLRVVGERYRVGVATILELVTSQISAVQAGVNVVTSRYDYVLARAQLEAVLGRGL